MAQNQQSKYDRFDGYIPVAERIEKFYDRFPDGRIVTSIVQHEAETGFILMRAEVFRSHDDAHPAATGHAFEVRGESYVNKTSYIENCETGAVGRALALLGFEVKRGIASREEMEKAARMQEERPARAREEGAPRASAPAPAAPPDRTAREEEGGEAGADERPAAQPPRPVAAGDDDSEALDAAIIRSANELGYDAVKVRKWVNQKYGVTGGLDSLTAQDKREVLQLFREQAQGHAPRAPRK